MAGIQGREYTGVHEDDQVLSLIAQQAGTYRRLAQRFYADANEPNRGSAWKNTSMACGDECTVSAKSLENVGLELIDHFLNCYERDGLISRQASANRHVIRERFRESIVDYVTLTDWQVVHD